MKTAILNKLTSSKNERKAFECIWDLTIGCGKRNRIITQAQFEQYGLKYRNKRNEAVLRLMNKKGIVFKHAVDGYWYGIEGKATMYTLPILRCVRFLVGELKCLDCIELIANTQKQYQRELMVKGEL